MAGGSRRPRSSTTLGSFRLPENTRNGVQRVIWVALATQITRWTPFLLFSGERKLPRVVEDLGKLLPPAMMGLLVVYSLRSTDLLGGSHGIPEAIAVAVTAGLHLWRRNTLLSILAGTACYMALVQLVF